MAARTEIVAVTIISFEEQSRGWLAQIARARTSQHITSAYLRLRTLLTDYCSRLVFDYDEAAVMRFQDLRKGKIRIGTMDLKIAAIVLALNARLLSRNLADFGKFPGLSVEDWT